MHKVICFGELLWDLFPSGKKPGGVAMNVAIHLHKQGISSTLISCTGNDQAGKDLINFLQQQNLPVSYIQIHSGLPTGTVEVKLDSNMQASYLISKPVAWDAISLSESLLQMAEECDALVFGSLACRSEESCSTLLALLDKSKLNVFDMNLRSPHYTLVIIEQLISKCAILKINEDELAFLENLYKLSEENIENKLRALAQIFSIPTICLTLGDKGAAVFHDQQYFHHPGYKIKVADTVGAGDAFLGSFINGYLSKIKMDKVLERACAAGALVASKDGASPDYNDADITRIMNTNFTSL